MSTRKVPIFLYVQGALACILALVFLVGNRSQPVITGLPNTLSVNQPIVIKFDRPMKKQTVEQGFKLTLADREVAGDFSWSSRSVAFLPREPLEYGATYSLTLTGIEDTQGQQLRKPYVATVATSSPRFLYLNPGGELSLAHVVANQSVVLSAPEEKVVDYAVSADGKTLLASFQDRQDSGISGLYSAQIDENGISKKVMLYRGTSSMYTNTSLCGPMSVAVVMRYDSDSSKQIVDSNLVSFPLGGSGFMFEKQRKLLSIAEVPSPDTFACSPTSDQVVYRSKTGNITLATLTEPVGTAVGNYQYTYGFSPKGTSALFGETTSALLPTNRVIYAINEKGLRELVSAPDLDSVSPAYNPTEDTLALSVNRIEAANFEERVTVVLRQRERGVALVRNVTEASSLSSDRFPRWSSDGKYLSFERIQQDSPFDQDRPRGKDGIPTDGEIWLAKLSFKTSVLNHDIALIPTGIRGSDVTWLP